MQDDEESTGFLTSTKLSQYNPNNHQIWQIRTIFPWILAAFFASLSTCQYFFLSKSPIIAGIYDTDFSAAKSHTHLEQRRFSHAIRIHENGTLYTVLDPLEPIYTGPPSPEIDAAWEELVGNRYFRFSEDEVETLKKDTFDTLDSMEAALGLPGYYGGVDFLHSLHCLNGLRKHLDIEYYEATMDVPPEYRQMHIYHCIDQIRQEILCHADTTPVTILPLVMGNETGYLGQTERLHTCRNSKELKQWTLDRGKVDGYLD